MTILPLPSRSLSTGLDPEACSRAVSSRDPRFDGLFFVGITSTGIYCRPVCPARVSHANHRRFFNSAVAAERAGFRPCLRCRPELAPGKARVDAVSRLARVAASRIEAGGLNGRTATEFAAELGVSARHLRRVLEREIGVSPGELALTHRLLLAKRLLADTSLSITRVAFASGFQSLRRFNEAFRQRYHMPPSAVRRKPVAHGGGAAALPSAGPDPDAGHIRLTLSYRAPCDWTGLLGWLRHHALPGVEQVEGSCYVRSARLMGRTGVVRVENAATSEDSPGTPAARESQLSIELSASLVPALMPLLPRLRRLFDLDAEPLVIDDHLSRLGLAARVAQRPGIRLPGALDGFEVALGVLLRQAAPPGQTADDLDRRVIDALGDPIATGIPGLTRVAPDAQRVAATGERGLLDLGVPAAHAATISGLAAEVASGALRLEPGEDAAAVERRLVALGADGTAATIIVLRALSWPDAFPANDPLLLGALGERDSASLLGRAERWRPWRAYAAMHLWLGSGAGH